MVQVVENWADITGVVSSVLDSAVPGYVRLRLNLTAADDVTTKPNFFRGKVGSVVDIQIRHDSVPDSLQPGARVAMRVRAAAPDEAFAAGESLRTVE